MKTIGYTINPNSLMTLSEICDTVICFDITEQTSQNFFNFIKKNENKQIIIKNVEDIGLQLVQMVPGLNELKRTKRFLMFLEKGYGGELTDEKLTRLLLEYGQNERVIMSSRTLLGIHSARKNGMAYGRPKLANDTIKEIRFLANNQGWSVREIANQCEVSVGTVHKYITANDQPKI
ncbi:hypothetical protein [Vagococcus salmoninarum]|uniref:hypothetical protein n=1 Tax=Vagococcus salmoninarum TaxID=2739 RepID=UPI003F9AB728